MTGKYDSAVLITCFAEAIQPWTILNETGHGAGSRYQKARLTYTLTILTGHEVETKQYFLQSTSYKSTFFFFYF